MRPCLIIGGFTSAIADAASKAAKASGVLRVQRRCVGWRSYGDYHQVIGWCFTTVAQKAQTINLRLKWHEDAYIKAKGENNLLMYYSCGLQSFFFVVISPDIV